MNSKSRLAIGILTAVAMFLLTFVLRRGGPLRDAAPAQFPMTAGVWCIFVLLFVKLKKSEKRASVGKVGRRRPGILVPSGVLNG